MYRLSVPTTNKFQDAWFLRQFRFFDAWQHTTGSPSIPIGILGGGLNAATPEFAGKTITTWNVRTNTAAVTLSNGASNRLGHALAALAVGTGGTTGVWGAVHGSPLVYVQCEDDLFSSTAAYRAAAIRKVFDLGARVVIFPAMATQLTNDAALVSACDYVWNGGGLVVASGLGTFSTYPVVDLPNVVAVGAAYLTEEAYAARAQFHHFSAMQGPRIDVAGLSHWGQTPNGYTIPATGAWSYGVYDTDERAAAVQVGCVAHLIWSANPSLTNAQVRAILLGSLAKSRGGWQFDSYFTKPGCGFPDAERAVLAAKATATAGVYPYLRLRGNGFWFPEDRWAVRERNLDHVFSPGEVRVATHGAVLAEVGEAAGAAVEVELWVNGALVYKGAPTSTWDGSLVPFDAWDSSEVLVVATTETGERATRVYEPDVAWTPRLTVNAKRSGGQALLSGYRSAGSAVTVSGQAASTPTSDTWEATAALGVGPNDLVIADGTDSVEIVVQGADALAEVVSLSEARAERLAAKELRAEAPGPTEGQGTTLAAEEPRQEAVAMADAKSEAQVPERRLRRDGRPLRIMVGTGSGFREVFLRVSDGSAYR